MPETIDTLKLIGSLCSQAFFGFGGILVVGFGELVPYASSKLKHRKHGILEIRSDTASWRIYKGDKQLTGCYKTAFTFGDLACAVTKEVLTVGT